MSSADGLHFDHKVTLGDTSFVEPFIVPYHDRLFIAWTGTDSGRHLNVMSSEDGQTFADKVTLGDTAFVNPSLAVFNSRLHIAWSGTDSGHHLNVMSSEDGQHFDHKATLGDTSFTEPVLAEHHGRLFPAGRVPTAAIISTRWTRPTARISTTRRPSATRASRLPPWFPRSASCSSAGPGPTATTI